MQENYKQYEVNILFEKNKKENSIAWIFQKYFHTYFEIIVWTSAIILLFLFDPTQQSHYNFCLFRNLGIKFCPGCGMGHSISYLLHGNLNASIKAHPLGIIALPVILYRIFTLAKYNLSKI